MLGYVDPPAPATAIFVILISFLIAI